METPFRHRALQLGERWRYARALRERGYARRLRAAEHAQIRADSRGWRGIPRRVGYKGEMRYGMINVMHHDDTPPRPMVPFYAALARDPRAAAAAPAAAARR